ncbi:ABC transporter substrate-binding protein [Poseidonocella sp. HB161398]|uniref:ABC transporter substrate-binding protein n=1 Tax=Poseidonocella sp. HB161398 TaxID=2320855 RepID=UPI00148670BB|nr:ABC transporter substrate-binding protein [Poseidonocella sp. HB161398]
MFSHFDGRPARALCSAAALSLISGAALAETPGGTVTLMNWLGGQEAELFDDLIAGFEAAHPGIEIETVEVTTSGDQRGGIRAALMGGQQPDLIVNTWPSFRDELARAGILRDLSGSYAAHGWDGLVSESWKAASSSGGTVYGLPYTYGFRSGIWYAPARLEAAGIAGFPADWESFLASFPAIEAAGYPQPLALPAKIWAHAEPFESLLLRTGGGETVSKLAAHEIPWTAGPVAAALSKYGEMLRAGCCGAASTSLATEWNDAIDAVTVNDRSAYVQEGMWTNAIASNQYDLIPGKDYALAPFPALDAGHDSAAMVDAKEILATSVGPNPEAADLFLDYLVQAPGANMIAQAGFTVPSSAVDTSLYSPLLAGAAEMVSGHEVQFVLGDMLPGGLADEYRVSLQRFISDPSEENVMPVLEAIEAAAGRAY